ncbi:MAG: hypothetical protein Q7W02_19605 [Candidatus Rokubacteria bacterium]|nr:hypothetical protein [Candidatus Rokubacteria bacterium]
MPPSGVLGLLLTLAGILLLFAFGMPYRLRTGGTVSAARKYALLGWAGLGLIVAGSLLQAYPGGRAPEPRRDFVIRQQSVAPLLPRICAETERLKGERTCYRDEWNDPIKALAAKTMGQEAKAINGDSEVEFPADSIVIYPDEGSRVLFEGCRAHACPTANVYFLVTPDGTGMDILWGSERGVRALGPNAELLSERKVYERLQEIKCRKMYPNLNPCKLR